MKKVLLFLSFAGLLFAYTEKDLKDWNRRCNNGELDYCHNIGVIYSGVIYSEEETGIKIDYIKANQYLSRACNAGYYESCPNLAYLYYLGLGVPKDISTAVRYYTLACNHNEYLSCYYLAIINRTDFNNLKKAVELYKKSCDLKHQKACDSYNKWKDK